MTTHAMIDLETLDVSASAVILSIGAVKLDFNNNPEPYDPLYLKLNIDTQDQLNRTVSESTLEWWQTQDSSIREEAFSEDDRIELVDFITTFNKWLTGIDYIWGKGYGFDMTILESLYKDLMFPVPWHYYQLRDLRTISSLFEPIIVTTEQEMLHNPLADAYYQAINLSKIIKHIQNNLPGALNDRIVG